MGVKEEVRQVFLRDGGAAEVGPPGQKDQTLSQGSIAIHVLDNPFPLLCDPADAKMEEVQGREAYLP